MIELRGAGVRRAGRWILADASVRFEAGRFTALLGPNGAGKSTLLRVAAGLLDPDTGEARFGGAALRGKNALSLARERAVLTAHSEPAFPLEAGEVVELGRLPWAGTSEARRDAEVVARALERVGLADRRRQPWSTLSAGERQRIQLARTFAQVDAEGVRGTLFLDEPTANLDLRHQLALLALAKARSAEGATVIAVLHDVDLALRFADRLVLLAGGRIVHDGPAAAGFAGAELEAAYGVRAHRVRDDAAGRDLWRFELPEAR